MVFLEGSTTATLQNCREVAVNQTPLYFILGALVLAYPDAASAVVAGLLLLRWLTSRH
jgi:hypothetical protein